MAELLDVTDQSFESEVLRSEVPVIVDFWGEHCPPCRAVSPILREIAEDFAGRVKIVKLNSDENGETMTRFQVMALPTILAFSAGQVVGQITGSRPKKDFVELVERAMTLNPGPR